MHTLMDELFDKAGAPWFNPTEKDQLINMAQIEFAKVRADQFELNERNRQDINPLVRKYTASATNQINIDGLTEFMRVATLIGVFPDPYCVGQTITSPVEPIQFDDFEYAKLNPLTTPNNEYPGYIQYNDGTNNVIVVQSTDTPTSLILYYIKTPRNVDSQASPIVNSELPAFTHQEIVNIAVRKGMMITRDQNYPQQINEIRSEGTN